MIKQCIQGLVVMVMMCAFAKAYAQELPTPLLSKEAAVETMLENNFGVLLANNNVAVAENNTDLLNTGYLPSVFALGGANFDRTDTNVDFGGEIVYTNQNQSLIKMYKIIKIIVFFYAFYVYHYDNILLQ